MRRKLCLTTTQPLEATNDSYYTDNSTKKRSNKISLQILFAVVIQLVLTTNNDGYDITLNRFFKLSGIIKKFTAAALCKARQKVSYLYFKAQFEYLIFQYNNVRAKYKGYFVTSIDGDQYQTKRYQDMLKNGYEGYPVDEDHETRDLKIYAVLAVDSMTGTPVALEYSQKNDEIAKALPIISAAKHPNIFIFDRLYFCEDLLQQTNKCNQKFIVRCKTGSTFAEVVKFAKYKSQREDYVLIKGYKVRLIMYKVKKNHYIILATNLDSNFSLEEIARLYGVRWESETMNKDATYTAKLEQFHAKSLNGILQEIFAHLWIHAMAKIEMAEQVDTKKQFLQKLYHKASFKKTLDQIALTVGALIIEKSQTIIDELRNVIKLSVVKRERNSRHYEREVKSHKPNKYKKSTLVPRKKK